MALISYAQSDASILETLGQRLKAARLERDESQEHLATVLGVSIPTYIAAEAGRMKLTLLVAAMRHLGLLENLNLLLPEETLSPILQVKLQGKVRQRASTQKTPNINTGALRYRSASDTAPSAKNPNRVRERFAGYTLSESAGSVAANHPANKNDKTHKDEQEW